MDWNLTHLKTLAAVAHHGSFSRAALALRLTQPAISMQIRQLEESVGVTLLMRTGRRVTVTREGQVVLEHAGRALRDLDAATEELQALRGAVSGRVRLGTSEAVTVYLLPPILARLRARHPAIEVQLAIGTAREVCDAVVTDELDLGIVALPARRRELAEDPLFFQHLVAVAAPGRAWGRRAAIDAATLARDPMILDRRGSATRQLLDDWFERASVSPHVPMEGITEAAKRLVAEGLGVSVVPAVSVREEVKARRLVARPLAPPISVPMGTVRRSDRPRGVAMNALLSELGALRRTGRRAGAALVNETRGPVPSQP